MKPITIRTIAVLLPSLLAACQPATRGKEYLQKHPDELSEILRTCSDGTHSNPQECSNAESLKTLDQKMRSLSGPRKSATDT